MVSVKEPVVFFDVDDTLVLWKKADHPDAIEFNERGNIEMLVPHKGHIQELIDRKMQGYSIVVWSQRGLQWCQEVVNKLNIQDYVDAVMAKPYIYYDDLPSCEYMGRRSYIKPLLEE